MTSRSCASSGKEVGALVLVLDPGRRRDDHDNDDNDDDEVARSCAACKASEWRRLGVD